MPVDDRLRSELSRLAPADPAGAFEQVLEKRVRRGIAHRAQAVALTVIVLAGTAAGFYGLTRVFPSNDRTTGSGPGNGLIVYSDYRAAGWSEGGAILEDDWHLYTVDPASQEVTRLGPDEVGEALYPAWSPDASKIAFVGFADTAADPPREAVYVMNGKGTGVTEIFLVPDDGQIEGLRWSPDGTRIGYQLVSPSAGLTPETFSSSHTIWTMATDGSDRRQVTTTGREMHFTWSPDGTQIAFDRFEPLDDPHDLAYAGTDLFIVDVDGGDETRLTDDGISRDPSWSPDGLRIAFSRGVAGDRHVAIIGVDGSLLQEFEGASTNEGGASYPYGTKITWSPDGRLIAVADRSDGDICSIRALDIGDGTLRTLVSSPGADACPGQEGMSWGVAQPTAEGPTATETSPAETETPSPTGPSGPTSGGPDVNLGLGFPVCFVEGLGGIDFLGDGTQGNAWTATFAKEDGSCPEFPRTDRYLLAVDHTGDGNADSWIDLPFECYTICPPFAATDLDGNGTEELIVSSSFSIMDHYVFTLQPDETGALQVEPILVAEPGHPPAGIAAGDPLRIDAGGDEGYMSSIECEGYPSAPVIVWSWSYHAVEGNDPTEVHVTRLELQGDGAFHVVGTDDFTVPAGEPSGIPLQTELGRQCGVNWYP